MHRFPSPAFVPVLIGSCLWVCGMPAAALAEGPFERLVASWMGVVAVIGAEADPVEADATFAIDDEEGDEKADKEAGDKHARHERHAREHRHREGREHGHARHHRGGHGDHPHHGPRPHGMGGPGWMGHHPGGPDMHQLAMRGFHEIIRRLARIEQKLGIEDAAPSGPTGEHRRHDPETRRPRGPEAERPMPRLDIPEDMRRKMEERMQEGRRRMEEAKGRMEEARKRFQAMEERIKQLEAEVERLKAAK